MQVEGGSRKDEATRVTSLNNEGENRYGYNRLESKKSLLCS